MKQYQIAKNFIIFKKMQQHNNLRRGYLKFARFLLSYGINSSLALTGKKLKRRWAEKGTDKFDVRLEIYVNFDDSVEKLFQDVLPIFSGRDKLSHFGGGVAVRKGYGGFFISA